MCGICGIHRAGGVPRHELEAMINAMSHRGPDDRGFYQDGPIGLASNRLSIIDIDGGRMPIANEDESIRVVLNGEIYNYRELRSDLVSRGHQFRTATDSEVIVHLYEERGDNCVEELDGMFAFAIWDSRRERLLLARDRIGQKPVFYHEDGHRFIFASEIKGLLAVGDISPEMDEESLHDYLSLRFVPSPRTMLKHVRKLPPAHVLVLEDSSISVKRYWDVSFADKENLSSEEWTESVQEQLSKAVASHLVSDVPVGAFLSGGLDSSMVVAMMVSDSAAPVPTFAIGVDESDFDELPHARLVADRYHTCHTEQRVQSNLITQLPRMIWHLDEPSDPIAACQYHAAEVASRHVKVVLGGDGGDELFAGFDRYYGLKFVDHYARIPRIARTRLLRPLLNSLTDSFTYKSITQKLRWIDQLSSVDNPGERYAEATCYFRFNHTDKSRLFQQAIWQRLDVVNSSEHIARLFHEAPAYDPVDRMLYADIMTRLPEHSLMLTDRMSMAHSLELRSPFLDHHLVAWMARCPADLKIRGRNTKHILRAVAQDYLPPSIVRREKQGFMFPIAYWFRERLHKYLRNQLLHSRLVRTGTFRAEEVTRLLDEHQTGRRDNHVRLWMLLNLDIWDRIYIGNERPEMIEQQISEEVC